MTGEGCGPTDRSPHDSAGGRTRLEQERCPQRRSGILGSSRTRRCRCWNGERAAGVESGGDRARGLGRDFGMATGRALEDAGMPMTESRAVGVPPAGGSGGERGQGGVANLGERVVAECLAGEGESHADARRPVAPCVLASSWAGEPGGRRSPRHPGGGRLGGRSPRASLTRHARAAGAGSILSSSGSYAPAVRLFPSLTPSRTPKSRRREISVIASKTKAHL